MINAHHFFEGPLCEHRLDPRKVIKMFNLQSDVDCIPQYKYYHNWEYDSGINYISLTRSKIDLLVSIAFKNYQVDDDIVAILLPYNFISFDDDFFTQLLLYEGSASWKDLLTNYLANSEDEDDDNDEEINDVLDNIEKYQNTGDLTDMYLYIFNFGRRRDRFKVTIEGIEFEYDSSDLEARYVCCKNQYVSLDNK